jgi:CBS domain-containing protein
MSNVKNMLREKGGIIHSVPSSSSVYEALKFMADKNIGAIMIIDDGNIAGIFTERDYARKVILIGKSSKDTLISEVMTAKLKLITVKPDDTVEHCMNLMNDKHFRHLPVMDNGELVGLISIRDVMKSVINEQKSIIQHLDQYITGR